MRIGIIGCGATGTRVARQLLRSAPDTEVVLVDENETTAARVAESLGPGATWQPGNPLGTGLDAIVLATRCGDHGALARRALLAGHDVVSVSDSGDEIVDLLALDAVARSAARTLVVGAGMMPGLSDVLAAHGARWFDEVTEIHVAKFGTGGPDCARQHHRALKSVCFDWRDGEWVRRAGGSGRELVWFPPPVQSADCYRAALGDPQLLVRVHPEVQRVTARMAATRRDRLTMHLPMLRRPHPEGLLGAVRVELRGRRDGAHVEVTLGCAERPAVAAGAVAAAAVHHLVVCDGPPRGAVGLAELVEPTPFLHELRTRGLHPELFVGAEAVH